VGTNCLAAPAPERQLARRDSSAGGLAGMLWRFGPGVVVPKSELEWQQHGGRSGARSISRGSSGALVSRIRAGRSQGGQNTRRHQESHDRGPARKGRFRKGECLFVFRDLVVL